MTNWRKSYPIRPAGSQLSHKVTFPHLFFVIQLFCTTRRYFYSLHQLRKKQSIINSAVTGFPWQKSVSYITTACEFLYFHKVPLRGQCTSRSYGRKIPLIYMYREITTNIIFDNRIFSIS
jgi:hypothetical protein